MWASEWTNFGIKTTFVKSGHPSIVAAADNEKTKLVWLEACSNPLLDVIDLKAVKEAVKAKNPNAIIAIDNTVLSPYIVVSKVT